MGAIFKKEIRQYLVSMNGYVFLAVYMAMIGYYFLVGNLLSSNGDLSGLFSSVFSALLFLIPILTMRLFAEEKRQGTDRLLLTAPVSVCSIVWGKFWAAWLVFCTGSLPFGIITAVTIRYQCFDALMLTGNIVCLLLSGAAFISIGIFASAVTSSQIVAAVVSYAILIGLWVIDYLKSFCTSEVAVNMIEFFSMRAHFNYLESGVFRFSTVVYFIGMILLMQSWTTDIIEKQK